MKKFRRKFETIVAYLLVLAAFVWMVYFFINPGKAMGFLFISAFFVALVVAPIGLSLHMIRNIFRR